MGIQQATKQIIFKSTSQEAFELYNLNDDANVIDDDVDKEIISSKLISTKFMGAIHERFKSLSDSNEKSNSEKNELFPEFSFNKKKSFPEENQNKIEIHPFRHLIFSKNISEITFKKHLLMTFKGLQYSLNFLNQPSENLLAKKKVILTDSNRKNKTLFLDLDETLISSCGSNIPSDATLLLKDQNGKILRIGINLRPKLYEFLDSVSLNYEIFVFTASNAEYAKTIVNFIDPDKKYIMGILSRTNCFITRNGFFIKDLRIIKNRSLKNMVIVDNLSHSFAFQIENGIPILEWKNDKSDRELQYLSKYLNEAANYKDIRHFNFIKLKLRQFYQEYREEKHLSK